MTNSLTFKGTDANTIYISQGSNAANGAPDKIWGNRPERQLTGAILKVDLTKITAPPLNVKTDEGGTYDAFALNAPVTLFASGVRNAFDLVWHSNGQLYVPTNGSGSNGNAPATPTPLPASCTRRIDKSSNGDYTAPQVPGLTAISTAQSDYLFRVVAGGYYGHPNPSRCEWVLNGGNPTTGADRGEIVHYAAGVLPDRNYRGFSWDFGLHYSTNGALEYQSNVFGDALKGKLIVTRFSAGKDLIVLTVGTSREITAATTGLTGMSGFGDPLDVVEDPVNGNLYVTEYSGRKITLLRPTP